MIAKSSEYGSGGDEMKAIQYEKLKFEIEKLQVEIDSLRSKWNRATKYVPLITLLLALGSFWFGFYQALGEYQRSNQLSEKEFRREFYKKQMEIFFDISQTAAHISSTDDPDEIQKSHQHFLELVNGNLGIVQNQQVIDATKKFEDAFNRKEGKDKLQAAARVLAAACRDSLKKIWQIPPSVFE